MLAKLVLVVSFVCTFASFGVGFGVTAEDLVNKLKEQWKKSYFVSVSTANTNFLWEEPKWDKDIKYTLASLGFGVKFHKHNNYIEMFFKLGAGKV